MKVQRPVVECRRQTEAIVNQHQLAASVATIHTTDLWNGLVAFVNYPQKVFGEIIEEAEWAGAGVAPVEEAGVVFYPITIPQLANHFHIIVYAFVKTLGLNEFSDHF